MSPDALVAQPLAANPLHELAHPGLVADLAGRVPVVELVQVAVQVLDRDVVVGAVETPGELGEEVLGLVGRDLAADVLALGVVDRLVLGEEQVQQRVALPRVGVEDPKRPCSPGR